MRKLVAATLVALALPSSAAAGLVAMRVQDVPLGARTVAAAPRPMNFNMLAVHWIGSGTVAYRTRGLHRGWRTWRVADADNHSGAWHDGNLDWTGASASVQFRVRGRVSRLRSYRLWSRVTTAPARRLSEAAAPTIIPRSGWQAEEEIVRARPLIAPQLKLAVVHHTAGTNSYTPAQAAAIVRGIEVYHVRGNGWNDIGYNFLVDRFGNVYEGRGGGIDQNVIGAHSEGFNAGTVGVALMGNYSSATPPAAEQAGLVRLLAWRLDVAHVDPLSTVVYTSGGNYKYRAGRLVTLRVVSGHRDTGPSECPGERAYGLLPSIARRVSLVGLPKLYSPAVVGSLGGPVRFQARLSSTLPWTVTVVDRLGRTAAEGSGRSSVVDWTWASPPGTKGLFSWSISVPGARAASGTIGIAQPVPPPPLSLTNLTSSPAVVAPNADGTGDVSTVSFTLGGPARVTAQVLDFSGAPLLTVFDSTLPAGAGSFQWAAHVLPDGRYRLLVTARPPASQKSVSKGLDFVVDRTLTGLAQSATAISPNGDGISDSTTLAFTLTQDVPVRVDVVQQGIAVATPFQGRPGIGPHTLDFDGRVDGTPLADGVYQLVVTVSDALGDVQSLLPLTVDTKAPTLTLLDAASLRFMLDEPATVTVLVNQKTRIVKAEPVGSFSIPVQSTVSSVSAVAQDAAGNVSAVVNG